MEHELDTDTIAELVMEADAGSKEAEERLLELDKIQSKRAAQSRRRRRKLRFKEAPSRSEQAVEGED